MGCYNDNDCRRRHYRDIDHRYERRDEDRPRRPYTRDENYRRRREHREPDFRRYPSDRLFFFGFPRLFR